MNQRRQSLEGAAPELRIKFGKHTGKSIEELPSGYLRWMAEKLEAGRFNNDALIAAANAELGFRDKHSAHWDDADVAQGNGRGPHRR